MLDAFTECFKDGVLECGKSVGSNVLNAVLDHPYISTGVAVVGAAAYVTHKEKWPEMIDKKLPERVSRTKKTKAKPE